MADEFDPTTTINSARDDVKQLVTLATAFLSITIALAGDRLSSGSSELVWLKAAWICLLVSIVTGLVTLWSLTGMLRDLARQQGGFRLLRPHVRTLWLVQILAFVVGMGLGVAYGFQAV